MRELAEALKRRTGLRMRQGVVTAVNGATNSVLIGGSAVAVDAVQHLNSCAPQIGDVVWITSDGADLWIIGTHGDPPPIDPARLPAFETYFTDADTAGAPAVVTNLGGDVAFSTVLLSWDLPPEAMWRTWAVYEGAVSGFVPGTPILVTTETVVSLSRDTGSGPWYYKVRAINSRGEASADAQVGPFTLPKLANVDLGPGSVYAANMAANAVDLASGVVTGQLVAAKLADNAVTQAKLAAQVVDATKLAAAVNAAISSAQAAADAADTVADSALTAANGKNKIIFSTLDASGTAYTGGDVWFKKSGALIIAQWEFVAGAWAARTLDNAVIGNVAAGAIGATELAAGSVIAGKIAALTITAAEIAAGKITGAKIAAGTITVDRIAAGAVTANEIAAAPSPPRSSTSQTCRPQWSRPRRSTR